MVLSVPLNFISKQKRHFPKFLLVGALSTIVNYSIFYYLVSFIYLNYLISSTLGYLSGVFVGFYLNKFFTFESKSRKYRLEVIKYFIVYTASLFLGLTLLKGLVFFGINVLLANFLNIGLTTCTNYLGSKYLVFSNKLFIRKKLDYFVYKYRYLMRYIIIGIFSVIIEIFFLAIFGNYFDKYLVTIVGFLCGMIFSFIANLKLNFDIPRRRIFIAYLYFFGISTLVYLLNIGAISFFSQIGFENYTYTRLISAGIFFSISYMLHRKITFKETKKVGVAIYLSDEEDVEKIERKVGQLVDWIHIDLVDETMNRNASGINLSKGEQIFDFWPNLMKMTHIMSKKPSRWISEVLKFSDTIIIHAGIEEDLLANIRLIKSFGKKAGVCIFAGKNEYLPKEVLDEISILQILGIDNPGTSGQSMNDLTIAKLNRWIKISKNYSFELCLDGGVKTSNSNAINSKYIVSGSEILNSHNSKHTIYDLKATRKEDETKWIKKYLTKLLIDTAKKVRGTVSATIVGSFEDKEGLDGISDIDFVLILDKLTKENYESAINEFRSIANDIKINTGYDFYINNTFGPLKFNKPETAVLHLMIYDVPGHIEHCIKSPFTCLDWQRSKTYFGKSLLEIFPINRLQPRYFFGSRRSVNDYMKDILSNTISYREYDFSDGVKEIVKYKPMTNKDKFEFTFHIMRFVMLNLLKLYYMNNKFLPLDDLLNRYFSIFPNNKKAYIRYLKIISKYKSKNSFPIWDKRNENLLMKFLKDFEQQFNNYFNDDSKRIIFLRHQKTNKNKAGLFLGRKFDTKIIKMHSNEIKELKSIMPQYCRVFSSPLVRAIETSRIFSDQAVIDGLLSEIDYGMLDGKDIKHLKKNFPNIVIEWSKGNDPRFPSGENNRDVINRLNLFLEKLREYRQDSMIITHNVVLRCLIGRIFDVPMKDWHRLIIGHLKPQELILTKNGRYYPNFNEDEIRRIFKEFIIK